MEKLGLIFHGNAIDSCEMLFNINYTVTIIIIREFHWSIVDAWLSAAV